MSLLKLFLDYNKKSSTLMEVKSEDFCGNTEE
jgi:hypothetical protein